MAATYSQHCMGPLQVGKDRQRARQDEAAAQLPVGGAPDLAGAGSLPEAGLGSDLASGIAASGVAGAAADHADDAGTQHAPESGAELQVCPAGALAYGSWTYASEHGQSAGQGASPQVPPTCAVQVLGTNQE